MRSRECSLADGCLGSEISEQPCANTACPSWEPWLSWTQCGASCNGGRRSRRRQCSSSLRGACPGPAIDQEECNTFPCDEPNWFPWRQWSV